MNPMSSQPFQAGLPLVVHRNHSLFPDYTPDRRVPDLHEWRQTDAGFSRRAWPPPIG